MIEVKNISKDFVSKKKYPGLKRVVKGLFTNENPVLLLVLCAPAVAHYENISCS